ncbi:MAG: hypothetical protein ABUK01_08240 [Leptospirales bacterium]
MKTINSKALRIKKKDFKAYLVNLICEHPANSVRVFSDLLKREPKKVIHFLQEENGLRWIEKKVDQSTNKGAHLALSGLRLFLQSCNFSGSEKYYKN